MPPQSDTFNYDARGFLVGANKDGSVFQYDYDYAGNRTFAQTPQGRYRFSYNVANRLSQVREYNSSDQQTGSMNAVSDKNGNLLSLGSDSFSWNVWGQMTGATQSGVSRGYLYDASGRLSSVQTGGSASSPKQWLGWTDLGSGDPGLGLDNPLKGAGGKWNLTDGVGSVSGQVDPATGAISGRQSFGPFGEEAAGNAGASGFGGRDRVGNGILYFRNRMYSPMAIRGFGRRAASLEGIGGGVGEPVG